MMKKNFRIILLACFVGLLLAGCGLGKMVPRYPEVSIKLDNENLENRGGQVAYQVKGTIPPKYMKKKATMTVTPTIEYNGQRIALAPIELQGQKAKAKGTVINYKQGGNFSATGSFEFKDGYEEANLVASTTANKKKASHTFPDVMLCEGICNSAALMDINPELSEKAGNGTQLLYADHGYKAEFLTKTSIIYFDLNKADLNMNLKLNKTDAAKQAVAEFAAFMKEGRVIDKIVVTGWASPEGEESLNQGLSQKRAEQGKKWFDNEFDKYLRQYAKDNKIKYKDLKKPEIVFDVTSPGEDWSGFERDLQASNIAEKNQILNVVRSQPNGAMKEEKIRNMTDIYPTIADIILPPLRRVEVSMVCNKNMFNDEQIAQFMTTNPDTLSVNEKLYAAYMEKDLTKKEAIYKVIMDKEEGDWRAYNNAAILEINKYIENGDNDGLTEGMKNLDKAAAISPSNGIILNNQGVGLFLQGKKAEAMQKFAEAAKATTNPVGQDYNLAMNKIQSGDYAGAAKAMNNKTCDYNMALVQMLDKNYTAAQNTLDCIAHKDAKAYYLAAVLAARTKNEAKIYENLAQAVKLDASYKAKAKKDAEFKKYKSQSKFQEIVR
ncbi:MAG: hypothetical protein J6Y35_02545 [Bacteroidales bacterium]|nr:hypothetical protein [Bacteroidales bacterium]